MLDVGWTKIKAGLLILPEEATAIFECLQPSGADDNDIPAGQKWRSYVDSLRPFGLEDADNPVEDEEDGDDEDDKLTEITAAEVEEEIQAMDLAAKMPKPVLPKALTKKILEKWLELRRSMETVANMYKEKKAAKVVMPHETWLDYAVFLQPSTFQAAKMAFLAYLNFCMGSNVSYQSFHQAVPSSFRHLETFGNVNALGGRIQQLAFTTCKTHIVQGDK